MRRWAGAPQGEVRSVDSFAEKTGGKLRFTNVAQETPIQEIWAYDVTDGREPEGTLKLSYTVQADAAPAFAALAPLNAYIAGRYPVDERTTVVALPAGATAGHAAPGAGSAAAATAAERDAGSAPIVHVLIPSGFGDAFPGKPLARAWNYGWENVHDGLDGVALDIPALKATPGKDGLIPLNIRIKDPIWPGRDMIDVSVSVRPGQKRTLWLDLRDRILTADSLFMTIASAAPDFGASSLDGMNVRLVFKDRAAALPEHIADRFDQVKDNWGFLVEEHTASKREGLYRRLYGDISDLLRVDPDHVEGAALLGGYQLWRDRLPRLHPAGGARGRAALGVPPARGSEARPPVRRLVDRQPPGAVRRFRRRHLRRCRPDRAMARPRADGRRARQGERLAPRAVRRGLHQRHADQRARHDHHRRAPRL